MKNVLILSPHWVSGNLVCTQRYRLLVNHLEENGWHPVVLAAAPEYYAMPLVPELEKTIAPGVEVHYVKAWFGKGCFLGTDVSWRAFFQLYLKGVELIRAKNVQALWVIIPSGVAPLIARMLHDKTDVAYGIDYTDPWVHDFAVRRFTKTWLVKKLQPVLERFAVRKAAYLAGVSELSYTSVIGRNPHLRGIPCDYFPLGYEPQDYDTPPDKPQLLWQGMSGIRPWLYAGAFLPHSALFMECMFEVIADLRSQKQWDESVRLFFTGTGHASPGISDLAAKHHLSDIVFEHKDRISYLNVLWNLKQADSVMVIGSTEEHYTASKIFQGVLSQRPLLAVFHRASSVNDILRECQADEFLIRYAPQESVEELKKSVRETLLRFIAPDRHWAADLSGLEAYSGKNIAKQLTELLNKAVEYEKTRDHHHSSDPV